MFSYTNRKGATYYLHTVKTKTGKTRYTMKRTSAGAVAQLPEGLEVAENVNAQVTVRVPRPRQITPLEEKLVTAALESLGLSQFRVGVKGKYITVFQPDHDYEAVADMFDKSFACGFGGLGFGGEIEKLLRKKLGDEEVDRYIQHKKDETRRFLANRQHYSPVFRFTLADHNGKAAVLSNVVGLGRARVLLSAGLAQPGDLQTDVLRGDLVGRQRQQARLVLLGERDLHDLVAGPTNGEGKAAVASAMAASNEG